MITLSYGYGEFVNYEKYAENFFEDPLILGLCHLYVSEVSGSLSVDKSRHRCHFDMIFRCNLYSLQGRLLIWSSKHRSWLPKSLTLSEREGSFSFAFMQSSSSSWRSNRSRILCIQFSKFCLVNGSMTYCLRPFVFPLLPVRSAWFRLMPPRCAVFLRHRVLRDEAVYLREGVHAFSAERGVPDAVPVAHPLKGTPAGTQYPGGLGRIDLPVRRTGLLVLTFADMACYLFPQRHVCGAFHCYHFHTQYFSFVSAAKFGNRQRGL